MLGIVLTRAMSLAFLFLLRSWGKMQTGRFSGGEIGEDCLSTLLGIEEIRYGCEKRGTQFIAHKYTFDSLVWV